MSTWTCPLNTSHVFSGDQSAFSSFLAHFPAQHTPVVRSFFPASLGAGAIDITAKETITYSLDLSTILGRSDGLAVEFGLAESVINARGLFVTAVGGNFTAVLDSGPGSMFYLLYVITPAGNNTGPILTEKPHRVRIFHGIQGQTIPFPIGGGNFDGVRSSSQLVRPINRLLLTRYGNTVNKINGAEIIVRGFR